MVLLEKVILMWVPSKQPNFAEKWFIYLFLIRDMYLYDVLYSFLLNAVFNFLQLVEKTSQEVWKIIREKHLEVTKVPCIVLFSQCCCLHYLTWLNKLMRSRRVAMHIFRTIHVLSICVLNISNLIFGSMMLIQIRPPCILMRSKSIIYLENIIQTATQWLIRYLRTHLLCFL